MGHVELDKGGGDDDDDNDDDDMNFEKAASMHWNM